MMFIVIFIIVIIIITIAITPIATAIFFMAAGITIFCITNVHR